MRISEQIRETMISLRNFRAASNARNPLPAHSAPFRKIGSSGYARILSKIGALRHALRAIRSWSNRRATRAQPGQRRATREPAFSYRNMRKMFFFQCGLVPLPPARVVSAVIKHQVYRGAKPGSLDNVWFGIKYTDGSATVEAPTPLMPTAEGRAALKAYVQTSTSKGDGSAKSRPPPRSIIPPSVSACTASCRELRRRWRSG